MDPYRKSMAELVRAALDEDIGRGDLTSLGCLEPNPAKARIIAKSNGILSGVEPALLVFRITDSANVVSFLLNDGDRFTRGDIIAEIEGFNRTILISERVVLNFLGHLSGIATMTRQFVDRIKELPCKILDTRKTTPAWRHLEKKAVTDGGGTNHRLGLYDMILIKDNHIASAGSIAEAVAGAREFLASPEFRTQFGGDAQKVAIEVEVANEQQLTEAIATKVDCVMLDNQSPESLKSLVGVARKLDPDIKLEASGNVSLDNVAETAATGVDYISVGAITHSAPSADFSLLFVT